MIHLYKYDTLIHVCILNIGIIMYSYTSMYTKYNYIYPCTIKMLLYEYNKNIGIIITYIRVQ